MITKKHSSKLDLTIGSPLKVILLFSLPLLLGNLFQQLYSFVDAYMVGAYVSDFALGAVTSSGPLINFFVSLIQGVSVGGGIVISQHFGAKDDVRVNKSISTLIVFSLFLGIGLTVLGYFLSPLMLEWMQTPAESFDLSVDYFQLYFVGIIFTVLYNTGSSILRALGDSKTPLYFLIISCFLNIILDYLFVKTIPLGVKGVAIGTIIAQGISCVLTYLLLFLKKSPYQVKFKNLKMDNCELKKIIIYGVPTGIQNSIISLSNVFIQANVNAFGVIAQTGVGIYRKLEAFATMPSGSFSMALSTFVSQNYGAQRYDRIKEGSQKGLIVDLLITELLGVGIIFIAPVVSGALTQASAGHTQDIVNVVVEYAKIVGPFYFMLAFAHGYSGIIRGLGYSKTPMFVMIIFWVIVRIAGIPLVLQIPGMNHVETVFWFYPFTWTLSLIVYIIIHIVILKSKNNKEKHFF